MYKEFDPIVGSRLSVTNNYSGENKDDEITYRCCRNPVWDLEKICCL